MNNQNNILKDSDPQLETFQTFEASQKKQALEKLAGLVTEITGACITLERENESAKLCLNGNVLETFSIWGDSPQTVLFDAMQAVLRHTGRIL
jgi:hypothetical protein